MAHYVTLVHRGLQLHTLVMCMARRFKSYDEAGAMRRIQCLKYLVLATMLMESEVDPFDAQEAAPYKQDPEVGCPIVPRYLGLEQHYR